MSYTLIPSVSEEPAGFLGATESTRHLPGVISCQQGSGDTLRHQENILKPFNNIQHQHVGMGQYLYIPFLVGWTSINPSYFGVHQGYKVLIHCHVSTLKHPDKNWKPLGSIQSPLGPFYSLLQQALWTARPVVQDACEEYQEVLRHEPHCRAVRLHLATRGGNESDRRD